MESTISTAEPSLEGAETFATDGDAHAEWCRREEPHPVPHPGCYRCDPAIVASKRAHLGGFRRTMPPGTPNATIGDVLVPDGGA